MSMLYLCIQVNAMIFIFSLFSECTSTSYSTNTIINQINETMYKKRICTHESPLIVFAYTGKMEILQIPENIIQLELNVVGASGGCLFNDYMMKNKGSGGLGSDIHVNITNLKSYYGKNVYILVGGEGTYCTDNDGSVGGYNGGGKGGICSDCDQTFTSCFGNAGSGGGGSSDIRLDAGNVTTRVIVASGGGGAGGGVSI